MAEPEPWTVLRLLQWTKDYLRQHGSETPQLDAEVLLAEARKCDRISLYTAYNEVADDTLRDTFRELVKRRAAGTPVAYLVGHREFYSLPFRVTPDVLIPRPETELLVVTLLDYAKSMPHTSPLQVADIGTGSGIVAVCAAKHLSDAAVTAVDISPAALDVARNNAEALQVAEKITFVESDLFSAVPPGEQFHFIVSNPPYIGRDELDSLPRDVRDYEPHTALIAGDSPMAVINRLVPQAAQRLVPGGWLMIEIGPRIAQDVEALLTSHGAFTDVKILKDLARLPRVAVARAQHHSPEN
jgi:release factor glutamine methyltransferase